VTAPTREECLNEDIVMLGGRMVLHDGPPETRTLTRAYELAQGTEPQAGVIPVFLPTMSALNTRFDHYLANVRQPIRAMLVLDLRGMGEPVSQERAERFADRFDLPVSLPRDAVADPLSPRLAGFDLHGRPVAPALAATLRVLPAAAVDGTTDGTAPVDAAAADGAFESLRARLLALPGVVAGDAVTRGVLSALRHTYAGRTSPAKAAVNDIGVLLTDEVRFRWIGRLTDLIDDANETQVMRVATLVAYCYDATGRPLGP
jgi:hypothetical protein